MQVPQRERAGHCSLVGNLGAFVSGLEHPAIEGDARADAPGDARHLGCHDRSRREADGARRRTLYLLDEREVAGPATRGRVRMRRSPREGGGCVKRTKSRRCPSCTCVGTIPRQSTALRLLEEAEAAHVGERGRVIEVLDERSLLVPAGVRRVSLLCVSRTGSS